MRWISLGVLLSGVSLLVELVFVASFEAEPQIYRRFGDASSGDAVKGQKIMEKVTAVWGDLDAREGIFPLGFLTVGLGVLGMLRDRKPMQMRRELKPPRKNVMWEIFCFQLLAGCGVVALCLLELWRWRGLYELATAGDLIAAAQAVRLTEQLDGLLAQSYHGPVVMLINGLITMMLAIWGMRRYHCLFQQFLRTGDWNLGTHIADR